MKKVFLVFLLSFSLSFAQGLKHVRDILNFTEEIVSSLPSDKKLENIKNLSLRPKTIVIFKTFLLTIKDKEVIGYTKFHEKEIYNLLFKVSYIIKFKKGISLVVFYFYKPKEEWYLYDFSFENDVKSFF